jgi:hypothetical protein
VRRLPASLRGSLLERTIRHTKGPPKCARDDAVAAANHRQVLQPACFMRALLPVYRVSWAVSETRAKAWEGNRVPRCTLAGRAGIESLAYTPPDPKFTSSALRSGREISSFTQTLDRRARPLLGSNRCRRLGTIGRTSTARGWHSCAPCFAYDRTSALEAGAAGSHAWAAKPGA